MLHVLQLHDLSRSKLQIHRANTTNRSMRSVSHQDGEISCDPDAPLSSLLIVTLTYLEFCSFGFFLPLRCLQFGAQCPTSPHTKHGSCDLSFLFFLKLVVRTALVFPLNLL